MKIGPSLPLEINVRFSEIEKSLLSIKALRSGDLLKATVVSASDKEALLDFGSFRLKADLPWKAQEGESLLLRVREGAPQPKLELVVPGRGSSSPAQAAQPLTELHGKLAQTAKELVSALSSPSSSATPLAALLRSLPQGAPSRWQGLFTFFLNDSKELPLKELLTKISPNSAEPLPHEARELLQTLENLVPSPSKDSPLPSSSPSAQTRSVEELTASLREANVALKALPLTEGGESIQTLSLLVPFLLDGSSGSGMAKVEYRQEESSSQGTSFRLNRLSLNLDLSNLGPLGIDLSQVGHVLRLDISSCREETLEQLKGAVPALEHALSPYFEKIFADFHALDPSDQEFFLDGWSLTSGAIDLRA